MGILKTNWNDKKGVNVGVVVLNFISALLMGIGLGNTGLNYLVFIGGAIYFCQLAYYIHLKQAEVRGGKG